MKFEISVNVIIPEEWLEKLTSKSWTQFLKLVWWDIHEVYNGYTKMEKRFLYFNKTEFEIFVNVIVLEHDVRNKENFYCFIAAYLISITDGTAMINILRLIKITFHFQKINQFLIFKKQIKIYGNNSVNSSACFKLVWDL